MLGLALPSSLSADAGSCGAVLEPLSSLQVLESELQLRNRRVELFPTSGRNCSRRSLASWARSNAIRGLLPHQAPPAGA